MISSIRLFLAAQAVVFFLAAAAHRGFLLSGYEHSEAAIAETVIGLVLLFGLMASVFLPRRTRAVGMAVQVFALIGTCIGLLMIAIGVGPQTGADLTLHVVMIALLVAGLVFSAKRRGT